MAYERRDTLFISGKTLPVVENGEITSYICSQLMKEKLKINLNPADISISHRIGRKPASQAEDRRNIILKLCKRDVKHTLLSACRKTKPRDFYLNESLTPVRGKIMYALRRMKRESNGRVTGVSSFDGRVVAWVKNAAGSSPGSRDLKISVNNMRSLQDFSRHYMDRDASNFIRPDSA